MQQILFLILLGIVSFIAFKKYKEIYEKIMMGKPEEVKGDVKQRWKNVFLIAFGQKKMFKNWIPALLHLFIYVAFLFTQVELLEIIIDGLFGTHRVFAGLLGGLYTLIIIGIDSDHCISVETKCVKITKIY